MLASCMGFAEEKKKCSTPTLQGIAYFYNRIWEK